MRGYDTTSCPATNPGQPDTPRMLPGSAMPAVIVSKYEGTCGVCGAIYSIRKKGLKRHRRSGFHKTVARGLGLHCPESDKYFVSKSGRDVHFRNLHNPSTQYFCVECQKDFTSQCLLEKHFKADFHASRWPLNCQECRMGFRKLATLEAHERVHDEKPFICASSTAGFKCTRRFKSVAGMVQHLESGSCVSGLSHRRLHQLLLENDSENTVIEPDISFTFPPALGAPESSCPSAIEIYDTDSDEESAGGVLLTPTSSQSVSRRGSAASVVEPAGLALPRGGIASLECPLCPSTRKAFISVEALQMHMSSSAHAPKLYRCPEFLFADISKKRAQKKFKTLGGLTAHLESGACVGGKGVFSKVLSFLDEKLKDSGLANIKLVR